MILDNKFIEDVFYKRKLLNHSLPKYRLSFILDVFETHTDIALA